MNQRLNAADLEFIRETAEQVNRNLQPLPAGKCRSASIAAGIRLATAGIGSVLVSGYYRDARHWWLEADNFVVDCTAGQFSGCPAVRVTQDHAGYEAIHRDWIEFEGVVIGLGMDVYSSVERMREAP